MTSFAKKVDHTNVLAEIMADPSKLADLDRSGMNRLLRQIGDLSGAMTDVIANPLRKHAQSDIRENDALSAVVADHFAAKIAVGARFNPASKVEIGATDILATQGIKGFETGPKEPEFEAGEKAPTFSAPRGFM